MARGRWTILIGAQWGDEGKGRITDMLAAEAAVVIRSSGGHNAGHTVIVGQEKFALHLIPSGILYKDKWNLLGNGMVVEPGALLREMEGLEARGLSMSRLRVSEQAHVILPIHALLDRLEEERKGSQKIGTTQKGIGPAYVDKVARRGLRMGDLLHPQLLHDKLHESLTFANALLTGIYKAPPVSLEETEALLLGYAERLRPFIADVGAILGEARESGHAVFFEGAQGTLLDLDHGTYPFVTSSNPTAGGACVGSGIGPTWIDDVIGIAKAYTTRVGSGPFPTELTNETGEAIRKKGHEYGTTTGRARRCGWLDIPMLRYAARVNGLTSIALTKLDVLSGLEVLRLCLNYRLDGHILSTMPMNPAQMERAEPMYIDLPGWNGDISSCRKEGDLPKEAQAYLGMIEEQSGLRIQIVSLGPEREQAFLR